MQRWVLLLSAYQYKIQHIPGTQNTLADCMSWLPRLSEKCDSAERIHSVVLTEQLPILACQIAKATETDKEISSIITCVQHGNWPSNIKSFTPLSTKWVVSSGWVSSLGVMGCNSSHLLSTVTQEVTF